MHQNIGEFMCLRKFGYITTGEEKMIKTITLSMCLAASPLSLNARAQDARAQDTLTRDALAQNDRQYILTARSLRWTTYKLSTGIFQSTSIG